MDDKRLSSIDEQGRRLAAAFARAEAQAPSRFPARRVLVPALAALAVVALLAGIGRGGDSALSLDEAVSAVSKAAFDQPALPEGSYLHSASLMTSSGAGGARLKNRKHVWIHSNFTMRTETWTRIGRPVLQRTTNYPQKPIGPEDRKNIKLLGYDIFVNETYSCVTRTRKPATRHAVGMSGIFVPDAKLTEVPSDAKAAYRYLFERVGGATAAESAARVWGAVIYGLMNPGVGIAPKQRAALAGAIAYVPGVKVLAAESDPNGNPTIGFSRDGNGLHSVAYFDRETSQTTWARDTVVDSSKLNDGRTVLPPGSTFWAWQLKAYEFVAAPPEFEDVKVIDEAHEAGLCAPPVAKRR